jgi:hypothetical protein
MMFTRVGSRAIRSLFTYLQECILILAVGVLGSQLLLGLNGGAPIGTEAIASTHLVDRSIVLVSSIDLDLDPSHPAVLRSVYVQVSMSDGSAPEQISFAPTPTSLESYSCHVHVEIDAAWHCPTPGLKVAELEQIVVAGS